MVTFSVCVYVLSCAGPSVHEPYTMDGWWKRRSFEENALYDSSVLRYTDSVYECVQ